MEARKLTRSKLEAAEKWHLSEWRNCVYQIRYASQNSLSTRVKGAYWTALKHHAVAIRTIRALRSMYAVNQCAALDLQRLIVDELGVKSFKEAVLKIDRLKKKDERKKST